MKIFYECDYCGTEYLEKDIFKIIYSNLINYGMQIHVKCRKCNREGRE